MTTSTSDLSSSSNVLPPVLLSAIPTGIPDSMSIALNFSTAMAAGSGTITITDGAVETVIDRVTGQPTMRVVGATDTHTLSASQLSIDGSHVTLNVANLLPGHSYSILMGAGMLVGSSHLAFGGVRSTSQVQFTTPAGPDTTAPTLVSFDAGGSMLKAGGSIGVTLTFSEAVRSLDASALSAPNASVTGLSSSDGGLTWHATLKAPAGAVTAAGNQLTLDMSKVQDLAGNAGKGISQLASYAVDTDGPSVSAFTLDGDTIATGHGIDFSVRFSEAVKTLDAAAFTTPHASLAGLHSDDGGITWSGTLSAPAGATSSGNQLAIDLSKVSDLAGNAGSGNASAAKTYSVDTQGPSATILLTGTELKYGETIGVTIKLSDPIDALPEGALAAPNATISDLHKSADGLTWTATLSASGNAVSAANAVSLDLSALHDANGNAGTVSHSANYTADNAVAAHVDPFIDIDDDTGPSTSDYVSNSANQHIYGTLSDPLKEGQHLMLTVDGKGVPVTFDGLGWFSGDDHDFQLHLDDGQHTIIASVVDDAGHSSAAVTQQFTIDTIDPVLVSSPDGATDVAPGIPLRFTFNEAMYLPDSDAITYFRFIDGEGDRFDAVIGPGDLSADRKTVTIPADQLHLLPGKDYTVYLPSSLTDQAGNWAMTEAPLHFHTSGVLAATSATAEVWTGIYGIGAEIMIDVDFNKVVRVDEASLPVLHLSNGGQAVLDHQSEDQQTLVFKYTVGADGEADSPGLGFADNNGLAGHVHDLDGNVLDTAHISYASLGTIDGYGGPIQIDAHAPPAPGAPQLDSVSDTGVIGDSVTFASQPTLTGGAASSNASIKLFEGDRLLASTSADTGGNWTLSAADWSTRLADGVHNLVVRQYDLVGNESPVSSALALTIESPAAFKLAAASDSGVSDHDGITNDNTPTFTGTALGAGDTIQVYDGSTLLGTTTANADKSWSFTVGSQPEHAEQPKTLADGVHTLTVQEADAAGNHSAASPALNVTIDTTAPTITASTSATKGGNNWFDLSFSEKIMFAPNSSIDVLDVLNNPHSHHSWDVQTNWDIVNDSQGVASVLELNLGTVAGIYHLQNTSGAIQDLAGNVAIIGSVTTTPTS